MTTKELKQICLDATIAGILIGAGCIVNLSCENRVVGSMLFSLGLITVILQKRYLFTGKVGYWSKENFLSDAANLSIGLCVNLLSIGLFCWLFKHYSGLSIDTTALVAAKMDESFLAALLRAIGCGMMMYIAVQGYKLSEKIVTVVFPVMVFILCGFDHCVANYGYMAMSDTFFCWQLPVWVVGNSLGSLIISKL